jgi:hypothetical protein
MVISVSIGNLNFVIFFYRSWIYHTNITPSCLTCKIPNDNVLTVPSTAYSSRNTIPFRKEPHNCVFVHISRISAVYKECFRRKLPCVRKTFFRLNYIYIKKHLYKHLEGKADNGKIYSKAGKLLNIYLFPNTYYYEEKLVVPLILTTVLGF